MHPSHRDLRLYVENRLRDDSAFSAISSHLETCEFCREYCESYREELASITEQLGGDLPSKAKTARDGVFSDALRGLIFDLKPLPSSTPQIVRMAADGKSDSSPDIENLATMYSQEPEAVLRIMRNNKSGTEYLQLMADDSEIISQVMVRLPDIGREYITDDDGIAMIDPPLREDLENMNWQIKMPDAVFSLEKLTYDPDATLDSRQVELTTAGSDRVRVTLESRAEGKSILIEVLELDGDADYGEVQVTVCKAGHLESLPATPQSKLTFNIHDSEDGISIRLFR